MRLDHLLSKEHKLAVVDLASVGCDGRWSLLTANVRQVAAHRCGALVIQSAGRVVQLVPSQWVVGVCEDTLRPGWGVGTVSAGRLVGWTRCWVLRKRARA